MWLKPPYTVDLGSVSGFMTLILIPKLDPRYKEAQGHQKQARCPTSCVILTSSFEVGTISIPIFQKKKLKQSEVSSLNAEDLNFYPQPQLLHRAPDSCNYISPRKYDKHLKIDKFRTKFQTCSFPVFSFLVKVTIIGQLPKPSGQKSALISLLCHIQLSSCSYQLCLQDIP